jgi:hypothetical protein
MARDDDDDYDDRDDGEGDTGIEVKTSFFPLTWIFFFMTPAISVDKKVKRRKWGTHFFKAKPGKHSIECWCPYLFFDKYGYNKTTVEVEAGEVTKVSWFLMGFLWFPGSFSVSGGGRGRKRKSRDRDDDDED